ncbi:MAG: hypothetical protein RQ990_05925 [Candidatus Hydrothermia bacterium]|jgi:hypothetical protein|nr:hypothetical protein [Candidatus Hydrothermia bacterium]
MFLLGFDFGISSYNISKIDFSYKGSVFSTKPTANGTPISFGFFGTYGFKESPLLLGFEVKLHSGSLNTKWDYYGFTFKNTTNFNITQIKFLIGLYASQNFIFQAIFSPQIVSLTFNGDNGSSNGSNLGFGIGGNMLFPVSKQFYIGFGMDFDYITSITTTYSENTNLNVIPKENKIVSLSLKFLGRII